MRLVEKFEKAAKNWEAELQEDEWYFANLREEVISELQPNEAFILISEAVDLILGQSDELLCRECFQLLLDLVRIANTTELNPDLDVKWDRLSDHVAQFGTAHVNQFLELGRWYRRESRS
jgi:hypothetical protein